LPTAELGAAPAAAGSRHPHSRHSDWPGKKKTPILITTNGYMLTASKRTRNLQEIIIMSTRTKSWKCMTKETTTTKANTIGML